MCPQWWKKGVIVYGGLNEKKCYSMLTHILGGQASVCSRVDKEDCLPGVLAEGDGSTPIQCFCLVLINGTV